MPAIVMGARAASSGYAVFLMLKSSCPEPPVKGASRRYARALRATPDSPARDTSGRIYQEQGRRESGTERRGTS